NRGAAVRAFYAAQSGLNYCRVVLAADDPATDAATDEWAQVADNPLGLDIPGVTVNAVIEDESARLNVNTATREQLTALPGMTDEAADAILDWRDADDDPRPLGAESDYYLTLPSPYEAGNGPFETVEELRLVRGVDRESFEGDGSETSPGWRNLITVRSGERNVDQAGRPRLNLRVADAGQLAARLGDLLTAGELAAVERRIRQQPPQSLAEVMTIADVPWRKLAAILDRVRVDDRDFAEGAVNLNTTSEPVLQAIGLPAEVAAAITERRATEPLQSKGELAAIGGVTRDMMAAVADRTATKSSVFRITASAREDGRALGAGVFALLDRSGQSPRLLMWRRVPFVAPEE
ncbi:MAG TPA: hypothetical protein VM221_00240, partial [Armatimonadota bacterium]|nr:hypothetical protein [Armatimonadota bacterium]